MRRIALTSTLLLLVVAGAGLVTPATAQVEVTITATDTPAPSPPPPPTVPAAPDISGTWDVTRSWFRRCPSCMEPVIRGTRWEITQQGHEFAVDRGLRGAIEGYDIHLEGIETNGFDRFEFYYSRLRLSPDGLVITGQFVGTETMQNPCALFPPLVTCFASAGDFYAIRRSPVPTTLPPATPSPTATETPTATQAVTATVPPSPTASATASPTGAANPAAVRFRYLPLIVRPVQPPTAGVSSNSNYGSTVLAAIIRIAAARAVFLTHCLLQVRIRFTLARPRSSSGQSIGLLSRRLQVRVLSGVLLFLIFTHITSPICP